MDKKNSANYFDKVAWIGGLENLAKLYKELLSSTRVSCTYDSFIRHFSVDLSLPQSRIHYNGTATELMCLIEDLIEFELIVRCPKMHIVIWNNFCDRNGNEFNADSLKTFMKRGKSTNTNDFIELIINRIISKKTG